MVLDSRVGLRVLGLFVLAAAVPMLLLTLLSQRTVEEALSRSDRALLTHLAKSAGMQTIERLRVARQALAADLDLPVPVRRPNRLPALLAVAEQRGDRIVILRGDAHADVLLAEPPADPAAPPVVSLRVIRTADPAAPALLVMRSGPRIGVVNPAFLWDGTAELPDGLWLCALDSAFRPLFCSAPERGDTAALRLQPGAAPERTPTHAASTLFLGADMQAEDWHFVVGADPTRRLAGGGDWNRTLLITAAAGLLLAILLSLVQIRRNLTPLQRLAGAARALARRERHTPIALRSNDEFGELATAFDDMAARLEGQFAELEALAAIDRQMVGRVPLARIHGEIADRLALLLPDRALALVSVNRGPQATAPGGACHRRGPATPVRTDAPDDMTAQALSQLAAAPPTSDTWLAVPADVAHPLLGSDATTGRDVVASALPLMWRDECFGHFVLAGGTSDLAPDVQRQIDDLRHRAAMAASAAERDESLLRDAHHDGLTGLLNRNGLKERLAEAISRCGADGRTLALLFIDLDRFKRINDSLGHAAGDRALCLVAARLARSIPERAFAARPAGDEFVVVVPATAEGTAAAIARAVGESLSQPVVIEGSAFPVSASIGVALCSEPTASPEQLLRNADQAMYEAKRQGGQRHAMFDHRLDAQAQRRHWIERDLPAAGARGELRLLYQPRIDRRSGHMESVEALIRWQHPEHGLCMPGEFIPVAEASELIEEVGRWVIDQAFAQARRWNEGGLTPLRVAINLSPRQLGSERLVADLVAALGRHRLSPDHVELEITEGLLLERTQATIDRLLELRRIGITLALDDFGTGYSSLAYLRSLPIDIIKIDRAFVKDLGPDASALAVARAIVALAGSLGMRTVAEGVETQAQLEALKSLHCDEMQGFLFSRPVDARTISRMLADRETLLTASGMAPLAGRERV